MILLYSPLRFHAVLSLVWRTKGKLSDKCPTQYRRLSDLWSPSIKPEVLTVILLFSNLPHASRTISGPGSVLHHSPFFLVFYCVTV